jgi:transposase-like protein
LFISDGLKGITDSIFHVHPHPQYQTCPVHLARTIDHKVRVSDQAKSAGTSKRSIAQKVPKKDNKYWKPFVPNGRLLIQ